MKNYIALKKYDVDMVINYRNGGVGERHYRKRGKDLETSIKLDAIVFGDHNRENVQSIAFFVNRKPVYTRVY